MPLGLLALTERQRDVDTEVGNQKLADAEIESQRQKVKEIWILNQEVLD